MKVLLVYDSVSVSKATKQVAEMIAEALEAKGLDAEAKHCAEVGGSTVIGYDCVIAGAPTMAFRMSRDMGAFLGSLKGMGFNGKRAAAFDTQTQNRLSGNAAKGIEERLIDLGFTILKPHLVVYVEGGAGKGTWQLKQGEGEKVKAWALEAAGALAA